MSVLPTNKNIWECMTPMPLSAAIIAMITSKQDAASGSRHKYHDKHFFAQSPSLKAPIKKGEWTPPTYYVFGYVAAFNRVVQNGQPITFSERHFDWQTGNFLYEVVCTLQSDAALIYRPAATYISISPGAGDLVFDADKDFDGDSSGQ